MENMVELMSGCLIFIQLCARSIPDVLQGGPCCLLTGIMHEQLPLEALYFGKRRVCLFYNRMIWNSITISMVEDTIP